MASTLIGWELLYKLIEANLKDESDVIIAIAHWFLIKEGGFRCLGTGDNVRSTQSLLNAPENNFVFISQSLRSEQLSKMNRAPNYCRTVGTKMFHRMRCDTFTMEKCIFFLGTSQTIH